MCPSAIVSNYVCGWSIGKNLIVAMDLIRHSVTKRPEKVAPLWNINDALREESFILDVLESVVILSLRLCIIGLYYDCIDLADSLLLLWFRVSWFLHQIFTLDRVAIKWASDVAICVWSRARNKMYPICCDYSLVCVLRTPSESGRRCTLHETHKHRRNPHRPLSLRALTSHLFSFPLANLSLAHCRSPITFPLHKIMHTIIISCARVGGLFRSSARSSHDNPQPTKRTKVRIE